MRMLLQELPQGLAQNAHAAAVDDSHSRPSRQESPVNKFLHLARGVVYSVPDDVDLRRDVFALAFEGDGNAASTRSFHRAVRGSGHDFRDVLARNSHLHGTNFNFKMILIQSARDFRI